MGAGAMNAHSREYGGSRGACQQLRGGADHSGLSCLPLWQNRFYRVDIGAIVQHVLRHLNQHRSRPASLGLSERFSDARANFVDMHGTRAESRRRLKDVELSA